MEDWHTYFVSEFDILVHNDRSNYQVKVDSKGITRVYDPKTNTFGSYNADGTTKTFFKPTSGQAYFNRQKGKVI